MAIIKHYVKLGADILTQPSNASLKISDKLNDIPTFECEIYNNSANRTALGNINQDLKIYANYSYLTPVSAIASSELAGYLVAKAHDNLLTTEWCSQFTYTEEYVEFDLGADKTTKGCRIYWEDWGITYELTSIIIDIKPAGGSYFMVYQGNLSYAEMKALWKYISWAPSKARYIKVRLNGNQNTLGGAYKWMTEFDAKIEDISTLVFTGRIEGEDAIEYISRRRIRISGYHKMIELAHAFFLRLSTDILTPGRLTPLKVWANTVDETTDAINAIINDVTIPVTALNDAFYIGYSKPFQIVEMKYSTVGAYVATVIWEYWNGTAWIALTCLDETQGFTKAAGTHYLIIPNKPSDWAATAVNAVSAYYIRMRVSAFTSATTQPLGDQFWVGDEDIARIQYDNQPANSILADVIAHANIQYGSSYTIAECPATNISLRGEYETHLKWISEIAAALTWTDVNGDKHEYDWWVDASNGVHIKIRRETFLEATPYDISAKLQVLNRKEKYKLGNRIWGLGYGDGINQLRNIREHAASQVTYGIRDAMFSDLRILYQSTLDSQGDTVLGKTRAPAITIAGSLRFEDFLDAGLQVGDWVKVHQPEWGASNAVLRLMGFDLDPNSVSLEVSNEMETVSSLIQELNRNVDILNKSMQGATNIYMAGPLLDNFERVDDATFYPLTLKVYIPTQAKIINKVFLNWIISKFRGTSTVASSANLGTKTSAAGGGQTSSATGGHSHTLGVYDEAKYATQDRHILAVLPAGYVDIVSDIVQNDAKPYGDPGDHSHTVANHSHDVVLGSHAHNNNYGIQEDTDTTPVMELKVGSTVIGSAYSTAEQANIDITPYMVLGWNTIQLYPAVGQNKRGRAQLDSVIQVFIESR